MTDFKGKVAAGTGGNKAAGHTSRVKSRGSESVCRRR